MAAKVFNFAMFCRRRKVIPAEFQSAPRPALTAEEKEAAKKAIGNLKPWKILWRLNRLELCFEQTKMTAAVLALSLPQFRSLFDAVSVVRCGGQEWQVREARASYNQSFFPGSRVVVLRVVETQPSGGETCLTDYEAETDLIF